MPILEIDGLGKVEVGNEFTTLAPEQQAAAVEEIAATMQGGAQQPSVEQPPAEQRQGGFLPISRDMQTGAISFDPSAGILGEIKDAFTLPGRAYQGEVDVTTREGIKENIGDITNLGGMASPAAAATKALKTVPQPKPSKSALPEIDEIKTAAQTAYKSADDAGVVVSEEGFGQLALDITKRMKDAGFNRKIHPKVAAALEEVSSTVGSTPTLKEMDLLRRVVKSAASSNEADERRIAQIIIGRIDDFVENLKPGSVKAGDAQAGAAALTEARALWSSVKKSEVIEEMIEKATTNAPNFSGSGIENALRTQFRQLANNKKKMRGFTKEEQDAIRKVARGGPIENLARMVGKFAPTGVVSSALSGGAGFAAAGPLGAVALPTIGLAGRAAATRMTKQNAEAVRALTRRPKSPKQTEAVIRRSKSLLDELLEGRSTGGGVLSGTSQPSVRSE